MTATPVSWLSYAESTERKMRQIMPREVYRFSEHKSTPLFDSRLPRDKLLAVLRHLADGCGVRQTARLVGVSTNTVCRLAKAAGTHAQRPHDEPVAFSPLRPRG